MGRLAPWEWWLYSTVYLAQMVTWYYIGKAQGILSTMQEKR